MTVWISRHFDEESYAETFDMFDKHFTTAKHPREMMLVSTREGVLDVTLWIRLRTDAEAGIYPGFSVSAIPPLKPTLLVAHQDEFEKTFPREKNPFRAVSVRLG